MISCFTYNSESTERILKGEVYNWAFGSEDDTTPRRKKIQEPQ